ncbi:MAG TPA: single-stranded-DNA-specific exonuclease RecJ [Arenicellales bacterium]|jgi:single-stranded-DNA-specific exonuclease|nr:single-stranded-DNA-specific exonuclease RecJ [Arenicellales bacterium]HJL66617.1 single-stranded-DNA-specific exonuclease RecJ [Arenicellales bacterium]
MIAPPRILQREFDQTNEHALGDLHPILKRIYLSRSITSSKELELGLNQLIPPKKLAGIEDAVEILVEAISADASILIVGDFDADGATSCALGVLALRAMGARHVAYIVPNRFEFGYGLTPEIVKLAAPAQPDLIITVDNGISSHEGIEEAASCGISVLVTDHHLPGKELPPADAIVNPNRPDDTFPSKALAGVGVIFYLMIALRSGLRDLGWFERMKIDPPNLAEYLDLVAVGTVADLVPLDHNNRILVAHGLKRITGGKSRPGINALLKVAGRDITRTVSSDLGFVVAPRLNAAGRLDDISTGIECLLSETPSQAKALAKQLDELNRTRREVEAGMQARAQEAVAKLDLENDDDRARGYCLFDKHWHHGVVGLVASRIKESTHRPVLALAPAGEEMIKGSARSIHGLHIRDLLETIATREEGLIDKFGGHAMAAGLSLKRSKLDQFTKIYEREIEAALSTMDLDESILTDGELGVDEINLQLSEMLRSGGPWGMGFPEPLFHGRFRVTESRVVGEKHLKMTLSPEGSGKTVSGICFNLVSPGDQPPQLNLIRAIYRLDTNQFRGRQTLQLIIQSVEPCYDQ